MKKGSGKKVLTRAVILLSFVSLFNDISSEMLYPVMPGYLRSIGFSIIWIGILEGVAEATAGLSKIYFGVVSDRLQRRMIFVRAGYIVSALSKPMLALFQNIPWIFSARTLDKFGKGLRTASRDALLSDEATPESKGTVFGFHRALDTVGASIGPVFALIYLYFNPGHYTELFLIATGPTLAGVLLTFLIHEKKKKNIPVIERPNIRAQFIYWKKAPRDFRKLMMGLLLFGIFNSSDIFLLLKAGQVFEQEGGVLMVYIFYNLIYAGTSYPLGKLADKLGLKSMLVAGLFLFATTYACMSRADSAWQMIVIFILYGLYSAATEGISKALISNVVPKTETATAIGFYAGWNSICALMASSIAGLIWYHFNSPEITFLLSAGIAACVGVFLLSQKNLGIREKSSTEIMPE